MKKIHLIILVALLAVGFILFSSLNNFSAEARPSPERNLSVSFPNLSFNFLNNLNLSLGGEAETREEAWQTFQDYLRALGEKDFESFFRLSHQISPTCSNPELRNDCEVLMDAVFEFGQTLSNEEFKNIAFDTKQAILYTDYLPLDDTWFERKAIYFTRVGGQFKVLGIRACYTEDTSSPDECIDQNLETRDQDQNDWWDTVEALFY